MEEDDGLAFNCLAVALKAVGFSTMFTGNGRYITLYISGSVFY
jgi:hypothetical protein